MSKLINSNDLLGVNVVLQCWDALYLGGLQSVLFFLCGINPVTEGRATLLVVLQLRLIHLQILDSEQEKERIQNHKPYRQHVSQ